MFAGSKAPHRARRHAAAAAAAAQQVEPVDQIFELCKVIGEMREPLGARLPESSASIRNPS